MKVSMEVWKYGSVEEILQEHFQLFLLNYLFS